MLCLYLKYVGYTQLCITIFVFPFVVDVSKKFVFSYRYHYINLLLYSSVSRGLESAERAIELLDLPRCLVLYIIPPAPDLLVQYPPTVTYYSLKVSYY